MNRKHWGVALMVSGAAIIVSIIRPPTRRRYYLVVTPEERGLEVPLRADLEGRGIHFEAGWPRRFGYGRGGPPEPATIIGFAVEAGKFAAKALAAGITVAIGKVIWTKARSAFEAQIAKDNRTQVHISVELRTGQQARAVFPGGDDFKDAFDALDSVRLPPIPNGSFSWALMWDGQRRRWILEL